MESSVTWYRCVVNFATDERDTKRERESVLFLPQTPQKQKDRKKREREKERKKREREKDREGERERETERKDTGRRERVPLSQTPNKTKHDNELKTKRLCPYCDACNTVL